MAEREDSMTTGATTYGGTRVSERDSRQIRNEIDRTRAEMDETFDALDSKLTPGQLALEAWGLLKGGSGAGANRLMRVAKQHPLPSLVIGAGVGWLLLESSRGDERGRGYDNRSRTRLRGDYAYAGDDYTTGGAYDRAYGQEYASEGYESEGYDFEGGEDRGRMATATHAVKDAAGSVKDTVAGAAHKAGDLAGQAGEKVGDVAGSVREGASHLGEQTRQRARQARTGLWQLLEERPLSVGAATLALGVIAGLSIPSTRRENELMGESRDRLLEKAKEAGEEALEKGKHVADAAVDTLKQEVDQQGLTPSGLVDKVRTVAKETANTVKEEARNQKLTPEELGKQAQGGTGGQQGPSNQQGQDRDRNPAPVEEPELARR